MACQRWMGGGHICDGGPCRSGSSVGGGGNFVRGGYLWGGVDFDTCLVHVCGSSDYLAFNSKNHGVELGFFVCV